MSSSITKIELFKNEMKSEIESSLYRLDKAVTAVQEAYIDRYAGQAAVILESIRTIQTAGDMEPLGVLAFILSRININNGEYTYKVYLYGRKLYIDTYETSFALDVSDVFSFFSESKELLYKTGKAYVGVIEPCDVETEIYMYIKYYNMYVVKLLRKAFARKGIQDLLEKTEAYPSFYVIQNEIYEKPYLIYSQDSGAGS